MELVAMWWPVNLVQSFTVQVISLILIVNVHIIIKLVLYNSCLNKGMVNCSGAIDVSLGH